MTDKYCNCVGQYTSKSICTQRHTQWNRASRRFRCKENISASEQLVLRFLYLIISSDLLSLDGSQVLSCLSALPVTFSKLYIQNEILSRQECTIWERSYNLEDTLQRCKDSKCPWRRTVHDFFFSPFFRLAFFIVIPHFSSHSTSNIEPRFQFVVWPFPSYILGESANSIVLPGL